MDTVHQLHAARTGTLQRRLLETAMTLAINASSLNATTAHDPQQDVSPLSDSDLHKALLSPWVLGVALQAIFFGVIASQSHTLYLNRAHLSWQTIATTTVLFCANIASFGAQTATLWFFSMSSLGEIRYVIMQCKL